MVQLQSFVQRPFREFGIAGGGEHRFDLTMQVVVGAADLGRILRTDEGSSLRGVVKDLYKPDLET